MELFIRKMSISRRIWVGFAIVLLFPITATILTVTGDSGQTAGTLLSVGIFVGLLVAWLVSRSVSSPIARTIETVTGIANGDIALNECLAEHHGDEVGELACVFNVFSGKVAELVSEVAQASGEVISAVAKTTDNANRITRLVDNQDVETEQVATAMNEMSATVAEVSRNACQADEATSGVGDEAATGLDIVTKTASSILELSSEVKAAGDIIGQVERDTEQIGSVLDVIKSIAEQTNLLALNAAIEAARAGEQGRGFAVVADEVRNLANRTQESTVEIEQMIVRLQEGARQAVSAMESGRARAELNVDQANQARDTLQKITAAVSTISDMNTQIATASEQQSKVAEEINGSISTINDGSTEVAQNFRSTLAVTDNLAELAGNLQRIVANFKLGSSPSIDFEVAKSAHLAWRARLRSFLDGQESLTQKEALSHHDCVLGKWYYSEGLSRYGHLPDMRELEAPHAELHGLIKNIVTLKEEGRHTDAENEYAKVETLSGTIIGLLNRVEQQVNTA